MLLKAIGFAAVLLLLAAPAAAQPYGNCPTNADQVCVAYHGVGALAMAYCTYEGCFDVNDGAAIRIVAGDDEGPFPRTWFAWPESVVTPAGILPCAVRQQGKKKFRLDIPEPDPRCAAKLQFGGDTYVQHFVSNPATGCLAWLECRLPTAP